jgi:hypothetical protein
MRCFRVLTHVVLSGHASEVVEVPAQQTVEVSVYTRSSVGGMFCIHDNDKKTTIVDDILVKDADGATDHDVATSTVLTNVPIQGPIEIKIKANSNASRFSTHNYLLVFKFKNK